MLSRRNFFQALGGVAVAGCLGESKSQAATSKNHFRLENGKSGQVLTVVDGKAQWVESRTFFVDIAGMSPDNADNVIKRFKTAIQQQKTQS